MAAWIPLAAAGIGALGGWLASKSAAGGEKEKAKVEKEKLAWEQTKWAHARPYAEAYGANYQPYLSPLKSQQQSVLSQYLTGELTPTQEATIAQQRRLGEAGISRTAAGGGMPMGGRSALAVQLSRDLALGAGQMGAQQQQWAMGAAVPYEQMWMANWLAKQRVPLEQARAL